MRSFPQGYYDTTDAGFADEEGFFHVMSRSDDVINVAGHRLSSGALEEVRALPSAGSKRGFVRRRTCVLQAVLRHAAVGDCAVVGLEDELKGAVPLALCVLRNGGGGAQKSPEETAGEIAKLVRETVGPVAALRKVLFVRALPKTRSGKIPRSSLADLVNGRAYKVGVRRRRARGRERRG